MNYTELKSRIPTVEMEIDNLGEKRVIHIYEWITQDETTEIQSAITGNREYTTEDLKKKVSVAVSTSAMAEYNKLVVKAYLKDLTWEEYTILNPEIREQILDRIAEVTNGSKKK